MQSAFTWDSLMYSHFHSCSIMPSTLSWLMSAAIAAVSSRGRRVEEEDCLRPITRGAVPEQSGRGARGDVLHSAIGCAESAASEMCCGRGNARPCPDHCVPTGVWV